MLVEQSRGPQEFPHGPDVIGNPGGHGRCHSQRLMTAAEVVKCKPASQRRPVVFPFLRESVGESGEAPRTHADAEILAFDMRRTDAVGIRLTHYGNHLHGGYFCRTVPRFPFARGPVNLDELSKANAV